MMSMTLPPRTTLTVQIPTTNSRLYDSLFCLSLLVPWTQEPALLKMQLQENVSIFACDEFAVYSNPILTLGRIKTRLLDIDLHCSMGTVYIEKVHFRTAFNTPIFIKFWEQVIKDGQFKNHDWTIKVD